MSNYPPGVTGFEYEILGPENEWVEVRECPGCGEETEFDMASFGHNWWGVSCCDCESYIEGEFNEWDGD